MSVQALVESGPIARITRVGHAPFEGDDPIELFFANGAVFHIDIGFEGATDIVIREGALLDYALCYCALAPDALTTLAHFSMSLRR